MMIVIHKMDGVVNNQNTSQHLYQMVRHLVLMKNNFFELQWLHDFVNFYNLWKKSCWNARQRLLQHVNFEI